MPGFNEQQQRELREAVQYLAQSKHHLSMAIVGIEQAMETLQPFKQNLAAFRAIITHLNTFLDKLTQAHDSIEHSLPKQTRPPKFTVTQERPDIETPWLTPSRIFWIAVGVWGVAMVIWFAKYVSKN